ncbi:MAG: hypothetical protein IJS70_05925 [Bacteroidales bacterium]|nr:hypothetical protein [Bacteroidales bacterium]MBQ7458690.1 hypothetical protein [Bacteroidales bacterium]MBQ9529561.1 hypothetical protein [Bacteroidales bacterium]
MRRILAIFTAMVIACAASAQSVESLLQQLDTVLAGKEMYNRNKEERINAIRSSLPGISQEGRYGIYDALYQEYAKYNLDSALYYARQKLSLAADCGSAARADQSRLDLAVTYINAGLYSEAESLIAEVKSRDAGYYHALHTLYSAMAATAVIGDRAVTYSSLKEQYRDSLIQSLPANDLGCLYASAEKMNEEGRYYDAILLLTSRYNDPLTRNSEKAILDYCLAVAYKGLDNRQKAKWHYASSAIADKRTPVREYRSLQELAFMLYEDGDMTRAYRYIACAMDDMQSSNMMLRTFEFAPFMSTISAAYDKEIRRRARAQQLLLFSLLILLGLLAALAAIVLRQRNALRRSNAQLTEVNSQLTDISKKLQETGFLKEEYLYQYMEQAGASIDRLEAFRRKVLVECRKQGADRLAASLEATYDSEKELRSFYQNFDETFLHLFPTFVQDVNRLLKAGQRLEPKPGRLMNTELRILALIRLGVSDNVKMSHFLRTSLSTIYNYRSKLRNAAATDPGTFEAEVARIGEIKLD